MNTLHLARGVTLIELLVGMAIATLMTVAGWRAIDAMQSARDGIGFASRRFARVFG
jgi:prepilin-type N-terminal cleavage/methylation domain-containing protein